MREPNKGTICRIQNGARSKRQNQHCRKALTGVNRLEKITQSTKKAPIKGQEGGKLGKKTEIRQRTSEK